MVVWLNCRLYLGLLFAGFGLLAICLPLTVVVGFSGLIRLLDLI